MSEKINLIELNRRRIAAAYLDFCQRHYGGKWVDIVVSQRKGVRVDITQQSIERCMIAQIEESCREEFGRKEGDNHITKLYGGMLSRNHCLTFIGSTVMEEMMKAAVSDALENPGKTPLQVVH
ncbi:hypothetical protein [Serratia sp. UGAL515B_01]|uniref:hypothetical protein n=1 Tax=Serratia sp. UGAL515B_01 TaxID=2986763 RepID=UPI00295364F5|nr:hypothetical protein [Serratia sp. UGAL515B_01]WON77802.1 hypothetical protein OK023_03700 [Serratia sp. UGAL515B_01]